MANCNKLLHLMLCYFYCSLAAACAETMWSVKQESSSIEHLNSQKDAVLCPRVLRVRSSEEALQVWSREHKSVLCLLGIEKQPL